MILHPTKVNIVRKAVSTPWSSTNLNNDECYNFCQEQGLELDLKVLK